MKRSVKQSGSIEIIIAVIVGLVIFGMLGFVVWKNYIAKDDDIDTSKQSALTSDSKNSGKGQEKDGVADSPKEVVSLEDGSLMTNSGLGIDYKMPSTWTGGSYGSGHTISDDESTTIKSPDGFVITMRVNYLTRGWSPADPSVKVLDVQSGTGTMVSWVVVNHVTGNDGPIGLQIVSDKSQLVKGGEKLVGTSIHKLGDSQGQAVYLEIYGSYDKNMTLEEFNAKESVKEAKAIFESIRSL